MTLVATKVVCYIPCVICSRGGAIVSNDGGYKVCVVGWFCGRGLCGYVFMEVVFPGYLDGIFLGRILV